MFATGLLLLSALSSIVSVSALPKPEPEQEQPVRRSALPTRWYHKRDHPVHELLKRDSPLPAVGSPQWTANYLQNGALPETNIPQKWLDALHAAEAANLIPNIALATSPDGGNTAVYADPNAGQEPICSAQYQCRHPGDIWDAPDGMIGLSVDDGPVSVQDASNRLYDFLKANNQKVTHFMIGANILYNPDVFVRAFQELEDDIGCHTWTHRHMSLLTNEQLVADLGWTMQIIHDSTGGRVPRYWRPPYGDADNRVRAVAKEIFGLTTVVWNNDSEDWTMAANGTTLPAIQQQFTNWLNGPRTPGLIVLEHEITADDVTAFINMYPLIAQAQGGAPWIATSVAGLFDGHETGWNGEGWYLNSDNDTAPVEDIDIIALDATTTASGPSGTQVGAVNGTHTGTASSTPTTHRNGAAAALGQGASGFTLAGVAVLAGVFSLAL